MNVTAITDRLTAFPAALDALCRDLDPDAARFRADGTSWSILEVVCHLADEEERDFPVRIERTLEDSSAAWDSIEPETWPESEGYRDRALPEELARFARTRADRVTWLRSLEQPDWNATYAHPQLGPLTAGDLLTAWAAHDALHLRQIARRLHELARRDGDPHHADYAGSW